MTLVHELFDTPSYVVFYSDRIRTLVAMAIYSSHRLIMGKEEIGIFLYHWGYLGFFYFTEMFIEYK